MKCTGNEKKQIISNYKCLNVATTISSAFIHLVISIAIALSTGGMIRYNWILLPKGAFSFPVLVILFVTNLSIIGALFGMVISDKFYRKISDKILFLTFSFLEAAGMLLWYNILLTSFAFFTAFIFSLMILAICVLMAVYSYKYFKGCLLLIIPVFMFCIYITWFSFSLMLIN